MRTQTCCCLLFLAPGLSLAQRAVDFEGRYWVTDSTQRVKLTDNGIGTEINFKTDLGFVDKNFPEVEVTYHGQGRSKLKVGYFQASYDGDKQVSRTLEFSGTTYPGCSI